MDWVFNELRALFGDRPSAILGLIAIFVAAIWIVYVFFAKNTRDPAQKYYELKLSLSVEAARIAAQIATSNSDKVVRQAALRFDELYFGELVLIEDEKLERAMVVYRKLIAPQDVMDIEELASGQVDRSQLRRAALEVSRAAFDLLQPSWLDQVKAIFRKPQKR
jgi:hypothetical protein